MDTQKVAVVLLIVAILFSVGTIAVSWGVDGDGFVQVDDCADRVECVGGIGSDDGNVGLSVNAVPTGGA